MTLIEDTNSILEMYSDLKQKVDELMKTYNSSTDINVQNVASDEMNSLNPTVWELQDKLIAQMRLLEQSNDIKANELLKKLHGMNLE